MMQWGSTKFLVHFFDMIYVIAANFGGGGGEKVIDKNYCDA